MLNSTSITNSSFTANHTYSSMSGYVSAPFTAPNYTYRESIPSVAYIPFTAPNHTYSNNNNTGNIITPFMPQSLDAMALTQLVLMLTISVIGTVSNALVLMILTRRKNRRKTSNILLLNLAVCDIFVSALCIPLDITDLVLQTWVFGKLLCPVIYPSQTALVVVSSYTMLFMLFERNLLFSKRIRPTLRSKTIKILASITWIISFVVVLPYALQLRVGHNEGGSLSCAENWPAGLSSRAYTITLSLVEYVVPMFFIVFLMVKICGYLRRERLVVRRGTLGLERQTSLRRIRNNKRLTITFIVMVTSYAILKLPNNAFWQWVEFGSNDPSEYSEIHLFVGLCAYSTCATNPFILLSMSSDMKKDVKKLSTLRCASRNGSPRQRRSENTDTTTLQRCVTASSCKGSRASSVRFDRSASRKCTKTLSAPASPCKQYLSLDFESRSRAEKQGLPLCASSVCLELENRLVNLSSKGNSETACFLKNEELNTSI